MSKTLQAILLIGFLRNNKVWEETYGFFPFCCFLSYFVERKIPEKTTFFQKTIYKNHLL